MDHEGLIMIRSDEGFGKTDDGRDADDEARVGEAAVTLGVAVQLAAH